MSVSNLRSPDRKNIKTSPVKAFKIPEIFQQKEMQGMDELKRFRMPSNGEIKSPTKG